MFADDTNLITSGRDLGQLITSTNNELCKLSVWFRANKLSLNIKKTNYIIFGNKRGPCPSGQFDIIIDNVVLDRISSTKFLGLFIDEKRNWSIRINHVSLKMSKGLGVMSRLRYILPSNVMMMLYHTLIYPYLMYCNIIWGCQILPYF